MLLGLVALPGCVVIDHGDHDAELPQDRYAAETQFHDSWHGISSPLAADDMRRR